MRLARRALSLSPSPTLALNARVKELKRRGVDVIDLGVGEPDFDTPVHIKEEAVKALEAGFTKYTPAAGIPELREAVCQKLARDNGLAYKPDQVVVACGAKQALYNAFQVICDEGDEVIVPSPYWVSYPEQVKLAGGVPVFVSTREEDGFTLKPEAVAAAMTPRTRAIVINSPNNPTGAVYGQEELRELAAVAVRHGVYLVSDECYEKMVYGAARHISVASFGPEVKRLTIVVNAFSKAYAMTGWRLGYAAAEPELTRAMADVQGHCTSNAVSFAQKAGVRALLDTQEPVAAMVGEFEKRREFIARSLQRMRQISCAKPAGAFYVFPNVSRLFGSSLGDKRVESSTSFAELALEEARVAVVPGAGFGDDRYVRISYAASLDAIAEGMKRFGGLVAALAGG